ncbi:MAG: hypothetical protein Q9168_003284 [Polycauliona sp. 1 TL-2023]
MPTLALSNFNIVCAVGGGFITLWGLVSHFAKERLYTSEPLIAVCVGVLFSYGASWLRPAEYTLDDELNLEATTLAFTRLALGIQLVLAGVQIPGKYCKTEWISLALLLGPGMTGMWVASSMLMWALIPNFTYLHALAVAACITPTDPVLSNSIVKGKFADENIPVDMQNLIVAESGANDGLGYPFLFFALYLIKYVGHHGKGQPQTGGSHAMAYWFGETWGYVIILSVIYGIAVGYLARMALRLAKQRKWINHENHVVHPVVLALFIVGTCGMIGTDDLLACFVAGNALNWDDRYRHETETDSFQETLDMLINLAIFVWFGAVCPWSQFLHNHGRIPLYRLVLLGMLILMFRRLPVVWLMSRKLRQCHNLKHTLFMGYFGPIGVGAAFYLHVAMEFLHLIEVDGEVREDAEDLREVLYPVVWFIIMSSILIHGLSVPAGKLAFSVARNVKRSTSKNYHRRGEARRQSLSRSMSAGHAETQTQAPRRSSLVSQGVLPQSPRKVHVNGTMPDAALESGESDFSLLQKYPGPE